MTDPWIAACIGFALPVLFWAWPTHVALWRAVRERDAAEARFRARDADVVRLTLERIGLQFDVDRVAAQLAQVTAERDEARQERGAWEASFWQLERQASDVLVQNNTEREATISDLATLRAQLASVEGDAATWRTQAEMSADLCASAVAEQERLARLYAPFDPARKRGQAKDGHGRFVRRDSPDTLKAEKAA